MTDFKMPSGADYGKCIRSGHIDQMEYIVGLHFSEGNYKWVVEHKSGTVIRIDTHTPLHPVIFGVDEGDWMGWVRQMFEVVDAWAVKQNEA